MVMLGILVFVYEVYVVSNNNRHFNDNWWPNQVVPNSLSVKNYK